MTVSQVEPLRWRKYPNSTPISEDASDVEPLVLLVDDRKQHRRQDDRTDGPRNVADQPRNTKPRKMNSSAIGAPTQKPSITSQISPLSRAVRMLASAKSGDSG